MPAIKYKAQWVPTLALLLVLPALLGLGFWQLDRAQQKRELQAEYDARLNIAPLSIGATLQQPAELQYHRVSLVGYYDHSHTVFLDNRVHKGVPGYYVVTPLKLDNSETRVLINRGWVPLGTDRSKLPDVQPPRSRQQITGVATVPHANVFRLAPAKAIGRDWQKVWQHLDMKRFIKAVNYPVQPIVVLLDPASQAGGFVRQWRRLDTRVTMHQGYAFQWFSMAVVLIGLYAFYTLRNSKGKDS